jgi:hypothetical protein
MPSTSVSSALRALFDEPGPASLGPGPRKTALPAERIRDVVARETNPGRGRNLLLALLLLWNDHHEEAHGLVQDLGDADGSLLHAILHRREPDFSNARYWLHRVGRHPVYQSLGERATALAAAKSVARLEPPLVEKGVWDPFAFAAACGSVADREPGDAGVQALCALQALETELLLERLAGAARPGVRVAA